MTQTRKPAAKVRYAVTNRDLYLHSPSVAPSRAGVRVVREGSPAIIAESPEVPGGSTALIVFWGGEAFTLWTDAAAFTEAGTFVAVAERIIR